MTASRFPIARWFVSSCLVASLTFAGLAVPAHAAVIATEAVMPLQRAEASGTAGRERLVAALSRADVVEILVARGVDPQAARGRAAALSDAEAARLAEGIDRAPAGGINALAAVALVFGVLVITDILGFTKIFSFTSPIK